MQFLTAWKLALRSRSVQAVFSLAILLLGAAYLGAAFSGRQPQVVAMDLGFSGIRIGLIFLNLFWIHELISKEIDRRSILLQLSFPITRASIIAGKFLAIQALSFTSALVLGTVLRIGVHFASWGYAAGSDPAMSVGYWATILLLWFEVAVVAAFALAVAVVSTTLFFPMLVGFLFALSGRMIGPMLDYLLSGAEGDEKLVEGFLPILLKVRWILPDLSGLDLRDWALYGVMPDPMMVFHAILVCGAYCVLAYLLAITLFERREFV